MEKVHSQTHITHTCTNMRLLFLSKHAAGSPHISKQTEKAHPTHSHIHAHTRTCHKHIHTRNTHTHSCSCKPSWGQAQPTGGPNRSRQKRRKQRPQERGRGLRGFVRGHLGHRPLLTSLKLECRNAPTAAAAAAAAGAAAAGA